MELTLQILLGIVALICFAGGMNLLLKGVTYYLPSTTPPQAILDNLFRFLSGIYLGMGFLTAWVALNIHGITDLIYFLGFVVICSGSGRFYSRLKMGSAGGYFDFIMVAEVILGMSIILVQLFR